MDRVIFQILHAWTSTLNPFGSMIGVRLLAYEALGMISYGINVL